MLEQGRELSNRPHIVVATPGRLVDHIESGGTFTLARVQFLVMDEADRLLGGMFDDKIKTIFAKLGKKRQNLFFSATINDTLVKLKRTLEEKSERETFVYEMPADTATVEQLVQEYVLCPMDVRDGYLVQTIREFRDRDSAGNIIVFTNTCK